MILEGSTVHALVFFVFLLTVRRIRMFFQPKTFSIPRGIIPQNFSSLGFAVSEELGNIQTHTQTHSLTDRLVLLQRDNGSMYSGNIETQQERKSLNFFPQREYIFIMIFTHFYIFNPRARYVKAFIVYIQNHLFEYIYI